MILRQMLARLKEQGYQQEFRREATCLYCVDKNRWVLPDSFLVDEYYHIADNANPDGERTLYAISTIDGIKGFLVDTCFVYEDNISMEMMQKLRWEFALAETV